MMLSAFIPSVVFAAWGKQSESSCVLGGHPWTQDNTYLLTSVYGGSHDNRLFVKDPPCLCQMWQKLHKKSASCD